MWLRDPKYGIELMEIGRRWLNTLNNPSHLIINFYAFLVVGY
jgi:hypothetical protein